MEKLRERNVTGGVRLRWKKQPDGKVFTKEPEEEAEERRDREDL